MNKLIVRSLGAGTALALVLAASQSRAQNEYSPTDVNAATINELDSTTRSETVSVEQFNPALYGTLDGVIITLTPSATYNSLYLNNSGVAGSFQQLATQVSASLTRYGPLTAQVYGPNIFPAAISAPANGITSASYGGANNFVSPGQITLTTTTELAPFIGTGSTPITTSFQLLSYYNNVANSGPFLNYSSGQSDAGATFHIEYEYSPVPEASTIGLIAGLGCLVALVRRARN